MNITSALQRERQEYRRSQEYEGVIGDENDNPYGPIGTYMVRFPNGTDANGVTTYGLARAVRFLGGDVFAKAGTEVLVWRHPYDGIETIKEIRPGYFKEANIDSRVLNPGEPISKWWDSRNFIRWLNRPTGSTSGSSATLVTTRENPFYWNDAQDWATFAATIPSQQLDLSSYIPAAGYHRLVITYFDVLAAATAAIGSTAKALATDLDFDDYLECRGLLPHNECVPLTAYELADAQTSIDTNALKEDLRSWIALPEVLGNINPVPDGKSWLLRSTHQLIMFNLTVAGQLTIEGSATIL